MFPSQKLLRISLSSPAFTQANGHRSVLGGTMIKSTTSLIIPGAASSVMIIYRIVGKSPTWHIIRYRSLVVISGWATTMASITVVAVAEDVPEAPTDDPVVPHTIIGYSAVIPPPSLGRCHLVHLHDLSVTRSLRYHRRRVRSIANPGIRLALWCQITTVLHRPRPSGCSLLHHHLIQTLVCLISFEPAHLLEKV